MLCKTHQCLPVTMRMTASAIAAMWRVVDFAFDGSMIKQIPAMSLPWSPMRSMSGNHF